MRHVIRTSLVALAALSLTACHSSRGYNGWCEADADCAMQAGFGKVCVLDHCKECGRDGDCKAGFRCTELRCIPRPECEAPGDCGDRGTCTSGKCMPAPAQVPFSSSPSLATPDPHRRIGGLSRSTR